MRTGTALSSLDADAEYLAQSNGMFATPVNLVLRYSSSSPSSCLSMLSVLSAGWHRLSAVQERRDGWEHSLGAGWLPAPPLHWSLCARIWVVLGAPNVACANRDPDPRNSIRSQCHCSRHQLFLHVPYWPSLSIDAVLHQVKAVPYTICMHASGSSDTTGDQA